MDPSTQAAQDVQNQKSPSANLDQDGQQPTTNQQVNQAQPNATTQPVSAPPQKKQISISGGGVEAEAGGGMVVQEDPDLDNEEEEALKVAPQEKKTQVVMGMGADEQDEDQQSASVAPVVNVEEAEIAPAVPEVAISSPELEKIVEITPPEAPKITDELKDIGLTHSGPGIIDVTQANFTPKAPTVTYEQALSEEEKIKENRLHNSRFWLLEKIKYLWRKVNPDIDMTVKKVSAQKTVPAKPNTVTTNPVPATERINQK